MKRRVALMITAATACGIVMAGTGSAAAAVPAPVAVPAVPAAATATPAGHWGKAQPVPGMAALNPAGDGAIQSISCDQPGDCAAGGFTVGDQVTHDRMLHDVLAVERGGRWAAAHRVYSDRVSHAFEAEEASGNWGPAMPLRDMDNLTTGESAPTSVSCSGPGNCAIAGFYESPDLTQRQAFVIDKRHGFWGPAQQVPGTADRNTSHFATVSSVSCSSTSGRKTLSVVK